jgi:hypothetical protein
LRVQPPSYSRVGGPAIRGGLVVRYGCRWPFPRDRLIVARRAAKLRRWTSLMGCDVILDRRPDGVIWAARNGSGTLCAAPNVAFASPPAAR